MQNFEIEALGEADLRQLAEAGIAPVEAQAQAERIRKGFAPAELVRACTPEFGVLRLSPEDLQRLGGKFRSSQRSWSRFVPASGASSRMFQAWQTALSADASDPELQRFAAQSALYPFVPQPPIYPHVQAGEAPADWTSPAALSYLLKDLEFGSLPKAAIPFHRYSQDQVRTPLEEHLSEAQASKLSLHFTVSPEHHTLFDFMLSEAAAKGLQVPTSLSYQAESTQSLALDPAGNWFRREDGSLLLRPSGHGALLPNLQKAPTAWVFVRNIDNVVPEGALRAEASSWREALAGLLEESFEEVQQKLAVLRSAPSPVQLAEISQWLQQSFGLWQKDLSAEQLMQILQAPLRICGVVLNTGEPGGGPFFVKDSRGLIQPQIVESAQVNQEDPLQKQIFQEATHFNPVELVCCLENGAGERFDLNDYVDHETGFKVHKSYAGRELYALERPGLWNGSMAFWLTRFVEIPSLCFAPVKTVHDLLRPEHQV